MSPHTRQEKLFTSVRRYVSAVLDKQGSRWLSWGPACFLDWAAAGGVPRWAGRPLSTSSCCDFQLTRQAGALSEEDIVELCATIDASELIQPLMQFELCVCCVGTLV